MIENKSKKWLYAASAAFIAWVAFLLFMAFTSSLKPPEKKSGLAGEVIPGNC